MTDHKKEEPKSDGLRFSLGDRLKKALEEAIEAEKQKGKDK